MKFLAALAYIIAIFCALFAIFYLYFSSGAREGEMAIFDVAFAMLIVVLPYCVARSLGGLAALGGSTPESKGANQKGLTPDQIRFEEQRRKG